MSGIAYLISTFFYAGHLKRLPGTCTSFISLFLWGSFLYAGMSSSVYLACVLAVSLIGWWAIARSRNAFSDPDPREVVIDEVAGQGLALLFCPPSIAGIFLGFVLFRFFDILKPWPISWIDGHIKTPFGVMFDDIAAGLAAAIILALGQHFTS